MKRWPLAHCCLFSCLAVACSRGQPDRDILEGMALLGAIPSAINHSTASEDATARATEIAAVLDVDAEDWGTLLRRAFLPRARLKEAAWGARRPCGLATAPNTTIAAAACAPSLPEILCSAAALAAARHLPHVGTGSDAVNAAARRAATAVGPRLPAVLARVATDRRLPCGLVNRIDGRSPEWFSAAALTAAQEARQRRQQQGGEGELQEAANGSDGKDVLGEALFEFAAAMLARASRLRLIATMGKTKAAKQGDKAAIAKAEVAATKLTEQAVVAARAGRQTFRRLLAHNAATALQPGQKMYHIPALPSDHTGDPRRWLRAANAKNTSSSRGSGSGGSSSHAQVNVPAWQVLPCLVPEGGAAAGDRVFNHALLLLERREGRLCDDGRCNAELRRGDGSGGGPRCSRLVRDGQLSASAAAQLVGFARRTMRWPAARVDRRDMREQARDPSAHHAATKEGGRRCCAKKENLNLLRSALLGSSPAHAHAGGAGGADARGHLQLLAAVEAQRRAVAVEYGVPLHALSVASAYIARIVPHMAQSSYANIHSDQSSFRRFHFTSTMWLSTSGTAFRGGPLTFFDDVEKYKLPDGRAMRMATLSIEPVAGRSILTSSGWENVHQIERVTAGARFSLQTFFTTMPPNGTSSAAATAAAPASSDLDFVRLCVQPLNITDFQQCHDRWAEWFADDDTLEAII